MNIVFDFQDGPVVLVDLFTGESKFENANEFKWREFVFPELPGNESFEFVKDFR